MKTLDIYGDNRGLLNLHRRECINAFRDVGRKNRESLRFFTAHAVQNDIGQDVSILVSF